MTFIGHWVAAAAIVVGIGCAFFHPAPVIAQDQPPAAEAVPDPQSVSLGEKLYMDGVLPSAELMTAPVPGAITLTGELVVCCACSRRRGLRSSHG